MKPSILLSALPLVLAAAPAFAQAPVPAAAPAPATAPAPAPAAPVTLGTPATPPATTDASLPLAIEPAVPSVEEKEKDEAAAPPDKLTIAKTGYFQPGANLQVWASASHLSTDPENEWSSGFRVRRAEIKARGEIVPKTFGYLVMFDVARLLDFANRSTDVKDADGMTIGSVNTSQPPNGGNTSILQDVALTWMTDYADVSIGQFKIPVSLEGAGSASKLYFPERALVSRRFGDRRDLGLKAEKKFDMFGYTLGLYNGEGQNKLDSNDQKDISLRLEVYPIKELTLAAVGYTALGDRELAGTKDRIEGDLKLDMSNVLVQAEYIRGWDTPATDAPRVEGQGFYVTAGYTLFDNLQPIVRIGSLDPEIGEDRDAPGRDDANDEVTTYEFGANYYFKQHDCKLQLAGGFFDPEAVDSNTRFDLTLAAQIAF
jgi:hypothetical protein